MRDGSLGEGASLRIAFVDPLPIIKPRTHANTGFGAVTLSLRGALSFSMSYEQTLRKG
ncbi:MAG: hypothetical protein QXI39_04235 [Candidatus Bathyarchaeia archaeon]